MRLAKDATAGTVARRLRLLPHSTCIMTVFPVEPNVGPVVHNLNVHRTVVVLLAIAMVNRLALL